NEVLLRNFQSTDGLPSLNGLRRVELQLRDYGNNASQVEPIWSTLYETSDVNDAVVAGQIKHKGVSFVAAAKWIPPGKTSA
ncbi:hypothetical protein ACI4B7_28350, partial [Klebsiella pneumoniae]|uniref:hypothetical protein n=1 Tax=Klebsiella pneumoniae TaxID=573 RepID=UPI0038529D37